MRAILLVMSIPFALGCVPTQRPDASPGTFVLHARRQVETRTGSGRFEPVVEILEWEAARTAVIVCDMWDADWCKGATRRTESLAPRVDAFVRAARREGAFIVHAPAGTMVFYTDTPQRRRALEAPAAPTPEPIGVRRFDPSREGPWPVDDSKSICEDDPKCSIPKKPVHTRQTAAIEIAQADAITDSGQEVCNLFHARGIRNVLFTGVNNNLCCMVRSFGIRQLRRLGFNVVLVRDLTKSMIDPRERPFVSVERATELVNEHIEKYWCPTVPRSALAPLVQAGAR